MRQIALSGWSSLARLLTRRHSFKLRWLIACWLMPLAAHAAPVILVFGDSLSAGYGLTQQQSWVALLGQKLAPAYQVINASVSGETTAGGLSRLDAALAQHKPAIVVLELGANDGLRGLPLKLSKRNLGSMIDKARQAKAKVLLVGMQLPPNFGKSYSQQFAGMYSELAQSHKVPLLPFLLDGFADKPEWFQNDMIHPTAAAQPHIANTVERALKQVK
ncbi:acyl-CoA thioesterase-1 [Chitinivorax tropicus]|uniref:Acyl-CoA thioesterase-1 n=2 Tax=Chitinivorax tropicus TaxID=714531 RepID=A0A840MK25_9PROT|nr:acyl-CoA thioesterase-1 [Chitinivorax tropicus]